MIFSPSSATRSRTRRRRARCGRRPRGRRTTPVSPLGTRRPRSCSAHRFGVAGTLALSDTGHVAPVHGDEAPVQREEVRLLRRDAGRVAARAGASTRSSRPTHGARRCASRASRRRRRGRSRRVPRGSARPRTCSRARFRSRPERHGDVRRNRPRRRARPRRPGSCSRGRRLRAVHATCPSEASTATTLPERATEYSRDPVRRCTRVEALVPEGVSLQVRRPLLAARAPVEADEGARVGRHADATAEHGRARVDPSSRLVRPADATRARGDGEDVDRRASRRTPIPSTTTGEDSTLPAVCTCHSRRPFRRDSAVTVPSCDETRMRGPSIAGLEGSVPPTRRFQRIFPVSASRA